MTIIFIVSIAHLPKAQDSALNDKLIDQEALIKETEIEYREKMRKARIVSIKSTFDHNINFFFNEEMKIANTLKITRPMAKIKLLTGIDHESWQEGFSYEMRILSFGVFPLGGIHTIYVEEIDVENKFIQTREKNGMAKVWDHKLIFSQDEGGLTEYEDNVTIYAGWMTPIFAKYLVVFYKMRHRKWNKLLNQIAINKQKVKF